MRSRVTVAFLKALGAAVRSKWEDDRLCGVVGVFYGQSMRVVSGVVCQKFRRLIDGHVINSTLHWAKEVVVKMFDMHGLVITM